MGKTQKPEKQENTKDYTKEYQEILKNVNLPQPMQWEKEGDIIKEYSLFEDFPTSISSNDSIMT